MDGYDVNTNTVYEFLGCLWHGCRHCHPARDTILPPTDKTADTLYAEYRERCAYFDKLREHVLPGLTIVEVWEHDFRQQVRSDDAMNEYCTEREQYYRDLAAVGTIRLRDAYFGGRTNNIRFYKECGPDEHFEIVDFCSLYPAVIAKYPYMLGHPVVIREHFDRYLDVESDRFKEPLFGIVKCKVLPPEQLTFPILPMKFNGRLEFVLCGTCGTENAKDFCQHTNNQRCITGTFTSVELAKAIEHGYRVQKVYEILHWEQQSGELFRLFVQKWIKVKTEASGYPDWVMTAEDRDKYVSDYLRHSGIQLDKDKIRKDSIQRNIAKNMLNSFYGKFAQHQNMETTTIINTYDKMFNLVNDGEKEVTGIVTIEHDKLLVNWKLTEEFGEVKQGNVNLAIASFITSYARLELWDKLNEIEQVSPGCVFYFDTDSIFYVAKRGMRLLPTGPLLGDLTREVGVNERVFRAGYLGAKIYGYEKENLVTGERKATIKCKGITLNADALQVIEIDKVIDMAKAFCHQSVRQEELVPQHRISSSASQIVTNLTLKKVFRATSEKRLIVGNDTFPKGYVSDGNSHEATLNSMIDFLSI